MGNGSGRVSGNVRLLVSLLIVASAALVGTQPASAVQSPSGCLNNDFQLNLGQSATAVHVGDTMTYNVSTGNPQDAAGKGCDVTGVTVTGIRPNGTSVTLQTNGSYPIGTPVTLLGTFTYVVNAADRNAAGNVVGRVRMTGNLNDNPFQDDPQDITKQVSAFVAIPSIAVTKQCVNGVPGQPITFSGTVTNTGNVPLLNVTCTDSVNGSTSPVTVPGTLAVGASANYSGSYTPTTSPSTDTVTCTGVDAIGGTATNSASATCTVACTPAVDVTKQCTDATGENGTISYSGTVHNSGNVDLTCTISDDKSTPNPTSVTVPVGQTANYSGSYKPTTHSSTDTVTVSCSNQFPTVCGGPITHTASATCLVNCTPAVHVTKQCTNAPAQGQPITYSGTVANTGNASLQCALADSFTGGGIDTPTPSSASLSPGASANYGGSYLSTTTPSTDTVTANCAVSAICGGGAVSDRASATCTVPLAPAIEVTKTCTDATVFGGPITISATVANTGQDALTNISCTDAPPIQVTSNTCTGTLAPNNTCTVTGSYVPTTNPSTDTITCSAFGVSSQQAVSDQSSATCTSGCPPCINPVVGGASSAGCNVFQLGGSKVSVTGPAGGLQGNICVGPGGNLVASGSNTLTGQVILDDNGATCSSSNPNIVCSHAIVQDLQPEINDALNAAASAEALFPAGCDQTFASLTTTRTISPTHSGQNVLCVTGNITLSGKRITLDDAGFPGATWIVIVRGSITLTGGGAGPGLLVGGGVVVGDVFYVVGLPGSSAGVTTSGGGGGTGCCKAVIQGTVFSYGKINLSPGRIDGAAIAVGEIDLVSGSGIRCPTCP